MKEKCSHNTLPSYTSIRNSMISKSKSKKPCMTGSYVDCEARWFRGERKAYDIAHSVETANMQASELQASSKTAVVVQQVALPRPGVLKTCYRCGKTGPHLDETSSLFIKSTAVVLHDCTLGWRHHSHTESSLAVKSVWVCYMPDNILVDHTPVQLKSFYCFSTHDVTRVRNCTRLSQGGPGPRNEASKEVCWEQRNLQIVL